MFVQLWWTSLNGWQEIVVNIHVCHHESSPGRGMIKTMTFFMIYNLDTILSIYGRSMKRVSGLKAQGFPTYLSVLYRYFTLHIYIFTMAFKITINILDMFGKSGKFWYISSFKRFRHVNFFKMYSICAAMHKFCACSYKAVFRGTLTSYQQR